MVKSYFVAPLVCLLHKGRILFVENVEYKENKYKYVYFIHVRSFNKFCLFIIVTSPPWVPEFNL